MDAQQFLAEFGHIANAPGGVARLRELVLQLAISGRLVLRDGNATPIERDHELRATHARKLKCAHPYSIPEHWHWKTLESVALYIQRGKSPKYAESGKVWVVSQKCVQWTGFDITSARYISDDSLPVYGNERFLRGGDLLWNSTGTGTVGRVAICQTQQETYCVADSHVTVVRPSATLLSRYLWCVIASPWVQTRFQPTHPDSLVSGTTQQVEFSTGTARALPIPVPPLEEQTRIVAKVDELMALCDKLEDDQQKRRKLQNTLRQATLQAVAKAQSPNELQSSWARLEANFGRLFSAPEDVAAFKGLVLDLAANGRLLPPLQRHSSTGKEVLEAIAEARNKWAETASDQEKKEAQGMQKKLRTQRAPVPSDPLPEHWCWGSLLQVAQAVVDCHNKTAPYVAEGIHLVRTTDIRNGRMDLTKTKKISEETYAYWARRLPPRAGDIFFTREAPMGEAAIVPEGEKVCLGQRSMLIRLFEKHFSNRYLLYVIMSPSFQARMIEAAIGMTVKHLRVGGVEDLVVPVPPKFEQDQIVESIERLFEICDRYTEYLDKSFRIAGSLATNSVSQLTGISIEQEEDEPVKVPQTELISRLRLGQAPSVKAQAPLASLLARQNGELSAQDLWQRYGGEIDAFYAQLKAEVAHGWIEEPAVAEVHETTTEAA
jgi:type I restriction enzyme, S subunit